MKVENQKGWEQKDIDRTTRYRDHLLENYRKMIYHCDNDYGKENRTKEQTCKRCYYESRGAFAAFTKADCSKCETEMMFVSSDVDQLCRECSEKLDCCKHCGAQMD